MVLFLGPRKSFVVVIKPRTVHKVLGEEEVIECDYWFSNFSYIMNTSGNIIIRSTFLTLYGLIVSYLKSSMVISERKALGWYIMMNSQRVVEYFGNY
jgi:hypothetical protein